MEEYLRDFGAAPPPPGLKERVLAAARSAPRRGWMERVWNRRTWSAIAAGALLAGGLYVVSLRPVRIDVDLANRTIERAHREIPAIVEAWSRNSTPRAMLVRLEGPHAVNFEELK